MHKYKLYDASKGKLEELVVSYRGRLARFGYESTELTIKKILN